MATTKWWRNGLNSKNGSSFMTSSTSITSKGSSVVGYYGDISGFRSAGSFSLPESIVSGYSYRILLNTLPSGIQIYIRGTVSTQQGVTVHKPDQTVNLSAHRIQIEVYNPKIQSSVTFGGYTGFATTVIQGDMSIYNYINRSLVTELLYNGRLPNPDYAYPRSGASGGTNNIVGMISQDDGLHFYLIGYRCVATQENISFDNPAIEFARIPDTLLNNVDWFNSDIDSISDSELSIIGGYEPDDIGDRPIDYDYDGTDIDFPDLPDGASAIGFGRMKIFHPTASALAGALDILWSDSTESTLETIVESCKKWWYKPEQYCVALLLMPVNVSGQQEKIYFGKYDTLQLAPAISNQWLITDCGSLTIPLKSGSFLDFAPYTKAMIYLPYVGFRPINLNEIMGGTISIKYYTDMYTGISLCMVKIANTNSNTSVLYEYECNIAQQIPITSENYNGVISSVLSASLSLVQGNYGGAAGYAASAASALGNPDVQTSGKHNPNSGALGNNKPYVVLHFPVQSVPGGFSNQQGFPNNTNVILGSLTGYTEVEKIHLNIPNATSEELNEIDSLLHSGVIL